MFQDLLTDGRHDHLWSYSTRFGSSDVRLSASADAVLLAVPVHCNHVNATLSTDLAISLATKALEACVTGAQHRKWAHMNMQCAFKRATSGIGLYSTAKAKLAMCSSTLTGYAIQAQYALCLHRVVDGTPVIPLRYTIYIGAASLLDMHAQKLIDLTQHLAVKCCAHAPFC